MKAFFDLDEFIDGFEKTRKKVNDEYVTIYKKDGIRYIDKPNLLITDAIQPFNYDENRDFAMGKVTRALEQLGLGQADLARYLKVSRTTITNYINRDFRGSTANQIRNAMYKICEERTGGKMYLSMTLDELFSYD